MASNGTRPYCPLDNHRRENLPSTNNYDNTLFLSTGINHESVTLPPIHFPSDHAALDSRPSTPFYDHSPSHFETPGFLRSQYSRVGFLDKQTPPPSGQPSSHLQQMSSPGQHSNQDFVASSADSHEQDLDFSSSYSNLEAPDNSQIRDFDFNWLLNFEPQDNDIHNNNNTTYFDDQGWDDNRFAELEAQYNDHPRSLVSHPESVDFTNPTSSSSSDMPTNARKRKAEITAHTSNVPSRNSPQSRVMPASKDDIQNADVVNLVDVDDEKQYKEFKAKQQDESKKRQLEAEVNKPIRLASFECIICMEPPTDLVVTHCGHLFCAECLHRSLYAKPEKKVCPVCRSVIKTGLTGNPPNKKPHRNGVFPLELKLIHGSKKGKQPVKES